MKRKITQLKKKQQKKQAEDLNTQFSKKKIDK